MAPFDPPDLLDFPPVDGAPGAPPFGMPLPPLARKAFALGLNELPSLKTVVPLDVVDLLAMDAAYEGGGYEGGVGPALDVELIPRASGIPPIGVELIPTEVSVEVHPELPPRNLIHLPPLGSQKYYLIPTVTYQLSLQPPLHCCRRSVDRIG